MPRAARRPPSPSFRGRQGDEPRRFGLDGPVDTWDELRREIHADICERGFDAASNSFTRSYGSSDVDAALLQLPLIGAALCVALVGRSGASLPSFLTVYALLAALGLATAIASLGVNTKPASCRTPTVAQVIVTNSIP